MEHRISPRHLLATALLAAGLAACQSASHAPYRDESSPAPLPPEQEITGNASAADTAALPSVSGAAYRATHNRLVRTASFAFTADSLPHADQKLADVLNAHQAFIEREERGTEHGKEYITMQVLVPVLFFDQTVRDLRTIPAHLDHQLSTSENAAGNLASLQDEMHSLNEQEDALQAAEARGGKTRDMLEVNAEIDEVHSRQNTNKALERHQLEAIAWSRIDLRIESPRPVITAPEPGFWENLGAAFSRGAYGFGKMLTGIVTVWPLLLVLGIAGWILHRNLRRTALKTPAPPTMP